MVVNFIKVVACIALMTLFGVFCRWMVVGINPEFGYGVAVGVVLTIFLLWLLKKVDPSVEL